jgi:hypothetical protein
MKKFTIHFLIFCIPIIVGLFILDGIISNILKSSNTFAVKEYPVWNDIYSGKINADVLIYGNSRAWQHISPKILKRKMPLKFYNLGIDGQNFDLQSFRAREYLKYNKKPKVIIQEVDEFTFEKHKNLYNKDQFLPYMLWNSDIQNQIMKYNGFHFLDFKIPLLRYYGNNEAINIIYELFKRKEKNPRTRINGFQGLVYNSSLDCEKLKEIRNVVRIDTVLVAKFNYFLKNCKKNNIKVILVYSPEFIEGQKCVNNRKEILNLFAKFSLKYNLSFYDYSNDKISYNENLFYNAMHMNRKGAKIFSSKFASQIKKEIMRTFENQSSNIK